MLVADQLVGVAVVPLNVTVLVPFVDPKFAPAIVTDVPTGPLAGVRLVTLGAVAGDGERMRVARDAADRDDDVAGRRASGTGTTMLVADQLVGVAVVPLNVTVLVPFVDPKFAPAIVTDVPPVRSSASGSSRSAPRGHREASARCSPAPPTVTTTLPVVAPAGTGTTMLVADQLVGVAVVPLNVTCSCPSSLRSSSGNRHGRPHQTAGRRETRHARCRRSCRRSAEGTAA